MPRTYDVESLVQDVQTMLKACLNTAIARVEREQVNAGLPPADPVAISPEAYVLWDWNVTSLNQSPGVGIFVASVEEQGQGPFGKQRVTLDVGVYLSGTNNDPEATRKLLRYSKALKEVFEANWNVGGYVKSSLETVGPVNFKLDINSSDDNKIAGVTITCTLG